MGNPTKNQITAAQKRVKPLENFIQESKELYGDKYDYSLINTYKNRIEKITLKCKECNHIFNIPPANHLKGKGGCKECLKKNMSKLKKNKQEDILKSFRQVHGNKYDYSLINYKGIHNKIKIICPEHGIFEQTPNSHRRGSNCPSCFKNSPGFTKDSFINFKNKNNGILYVIRCWNEEEEFYKIGITKLTIKKRFLSKKEMPYNYEIIQEIQDTPENIFDLEYLLHRIYKQMGYHYKPIKTFKGYSECFKINQ